MKKKRPPKITYGRVPRYTSTEQAIKDLSKKMKEQQKAKEVKK